MRVTGKVFYQICMALSFVMPLTVGVDLKASCNCSTYERSYQQILSRKKRFMLFSKGANVLVWFKFCQSFLCIDLIFDFYSIHRILENKLCLVFRQALIGYKNWICFIHYRLSHGFSHRQKICCLANIMWNPLNHRGW